MKIVRIYKENSKRVVIEFDDGNSLSVFKDLAYQSSLRKGDEINESLFGELQAKQIIFEIREKALFLLARRAHSKYELKQKLLQKKFNKDKIDAVLNKIEEEGFLNDLEFAKLFISERIGKGKSGPLKIKNELAAKGIKRETIEEVMRIFFPSEENEEAAFEIAEKKLRQLRNRNIEAHLIKQKLYSFLISRGFSFEVSKRAAEKILEKV